MGNPRISVMFILLALLLLGCVDLSTGISPANYSNPAVPTYQSEEVILELGTVAEHTAMGSFVWSASKRNKVVAIERGCGCAVTSLEVGEVVNDNDVVRVSIDLHGKPGGAGEQRIKFEFEEGTPLTLIVRYVYLPPPFAMPSSFVLRDSLRSVTVKATFPVAMPDDEPFVECPEFLRCSIANRTNTTADLEFIVEDIDGLVGVDGVICIKSSVVDIPIRLPFIILRN